MAKNVSYRDKATADPPNATLSRLPENGLIVWAVIFNPGHPGDDPVQTTRWRGTAHASFANTRARCSPLGRFNDEHGRVAVAAYIEDSEITHRTKIDGHPSLSFEGDGKRTLDAAPAHFALLGVKEYEVFHLCAICHRRSLLRFWIGVRARGWSGRMKHQECIPRR